MLIYCPIGATLLDYLIAYSSHLFYQDLEKAFSKVRRKNNSKKPAHKSA